ncbi:MAG: DUF4340 domain-containing protein [Nitrospiria bacterium]
MRFKATVVLTAFLIILGIYLLYIELPREEKQKTAALTAGRLFSFSTLEITRVRIEGPKGVFELEYFPDHPESPWRMFLPVVTIANEDAASRLASQLEGIRSNRLIEERPTDLKDFGLDPPAYTVIITLNQTDTEILEIGSENLTGSDVYVRKGQGTSLYLVPAGIKGFLDKDLKDWRQQEVFPAASFDIKKVQIQSSRGLLQVSRDDEAWSVRIEPPEGADRKPVSARGDAGEISNLLGSLVNLRGDSFIDKQKEAVKEGLGSPILKIKLGVSEVERDGEFYRTENDPGVVYVVTTDLAPIYQISEQSFEAIDQPFSAFRDKRVVTLTTPEQIEEITIDRSGESLLLQRKEGAWWMEKPAQKKVEAAGRISRLLTDIYNLRVEEFLDELDRKSPKAGLNNPTLSLQLKGKGGVSLGDIAFGRIEGEKIYARSTGHPSPFFLNKGERDRLPTKEDLFPAPEPDIGEESSPPES